jgi:hypothetical protein
MLVGWALNGFGSWRFSRGRAVLVTLLLYVAWFTLAGLLALDSSVSMPQLVVLPNVILPIFVGATMLREERDWRQLLWTGPHDSASPLGAGRNGEVSRAKDTRLGRDVAIELARGTRRRRRSPGVV